MRKIGENENENSPVNRSNNYVFNEYHVIESCRRVVAKNYRGDSYLATKANPTVRRMIASVSSAERLRPTQRGEIAGRLFRSSGASKRDPETPRMRGFPSTSDFQGIFALILSQPFGGRWEDDATWRVVDVDVDEANFQPRGLHSHPFLSFFPSSNVIRLKLLTDLLPFL